MEDRVIDLMSSGSFTVRVPPAKYHKSGPRSETPSGVGEGQDEQQALNRGVAPLSPGVISLNEGQNAGECNNTGDLVEISSRLEQVSLVSIPSSNRTGAHGVDSSLALGSGDAEPPRAPEVRVVEVESVDNQLHSKAVNSPESNNSV